MPTSSPAAATRKGLRHFDPTAVAKVVEFGSRLAEDKRKLSTLFGMIADLVREASYWAGANGRSEVTAYDVQQALTERTERANRLEEDMFEQFLDGTIFIATEESVVGQVNGLSVIDTGDYSFGLPGRITARTFMGDDGVIHIERETEMSGPIHEKGVLTLNGYLGGTYAQHQPLSLTASLTFEQNYSGIDGDSASSTELYALLSSLSEIPIKQSLAVTGSVNQRGEIQPIGGVNEKIEGFYRLCEARGFTGEQGVLIPASNIENLMLHERVVTAVTEGKFHIWPIGRIDCWGAPSAKKIILNCTTPCRPACWRHSAKASRLHKRKMANSFVSFRFGSVPCIMRCVFIQQATNHQETTCRAGPPALDILNRTLHTRFCSS
jgi:predicted ATP-dependent protease